MEEQQKAVLAMIFYNMAGIREEERDRMVNVA
jgi:hypothetical protein